MSKFVKEDFNYSGGYLTYIGDQGQFNEYYQEPCHPTRLGMRKDAFVARFKYGGGSAHFKAFLIKNFTVEEYFGLTSRKAIGGQDLAPLTALETKGYLSPNARKSIKHHNEYNGTDFPLTLQGFEDTIAAICDNREVA